MLLERLIAYYGVCGDEESAFIAKRIDSYSEDAQDRLFEAITAENGKRYGFPDLSKLTKAFKDIRPDVDGKTENVVFWWRCKCGCEYFDLPECPACGAKGMDERALKSAGHLPDFTKDVVRFNKPYKTTTDGSVSCYDCEHKYGSFCWNFGVKGYDCPRRTECPCNACCMRACEQ